MTGLDCQQKQDVDLMLVWCGASVICGGSTSNQHWVSVRVAWVETTSCRGPI